MFNELDLFQAKKIIRDLAKAKGLSEKEVRLEMELAIDAGFSNSDPSVRMAWAPFDGKRPTPEEFILWCAAQI